MNEKVLAAAPTTALAYGPMKNIIRLNYEAVRHATVATAPCPHIVVPDFLKGESLQRVVSLLPEIRSGGSYPPEALSLHPAMVGMMAEFQGPRLKEMIADKFALDLENAPSMMTIRGRTRAKDGKIHRDSASKRVTILLYLNDPSRSWECHEGCLRFLNGPHDIEDYACEIPPKGGTLVVFPNGPQTWHGHKQYIGPRYTIQLNYMAETRQARRELQRHKWSALWKSLPFTA